jgi:high affinity Mn2+ porin
MPVILARVHHRTVSSVLSNVDDRVSRPTLPGIGCLRSVPKAPLFVLSAAAMWAGCPANGRAQGVSQAAQPQGVAVTPEPSQPPRANDAAPAILLPYDWNGFYVGGNLGYAFGHSNWNAGQGNAGSLSFAQPLDSFNQSGSILGGVQAGYNYLLPNRFLIGGEVDASFPGYQTLSGISTGNIASFTSQMLGAQSYSDTLLEAGTARLRLGYAPADWLFYVTGGFAWAKDQLSLTQVPTGVTGSPTALRLGWAAGAGLEVPIIPNWTVRAEYLFTDYGRTTVNFGSGLQSTASDLALSELRVGLDYQFGGNPFSAEVPTVPALPAWTNWITDNVSLHGQVTETWQGYPAFHSPYEGPNSLPGGGEGRQTTDVILYAGARLWPGAELWFNPEIDQGFGLADTHGVAGFTSGESYKLGFAYPYVRANRYFIRQTIDLGGETQKVDADVNQFEEATTENRLVLTAGRFYVIDIFDTNKYANNPKVDFLNWSVINAGTFDFAGDAWSSTYGAAAEWYQGPWTLRGGIFDMSATPAGGGGNSAEGYELDPTFSQLEFVAELERRYTVWDQPGTAKVTGFLIDGRMGSFSDALAFSQATGLDASDALAAVRKWQTRQGGSLNLAQQVSDTIGVFGRAGWSDGNVEPWDNTDIDRTVEVGVSLSGKGWNRPNDTIGVAGVLNGITKAHAAYLNAGGVGIVIGDGQLPKPGWEQILESYYNYALTPSVGVSLDYQFIRNPAYNLDRGPVNVFGGRFHWSF